MNIKNYIKNIFKIKNEDEFNKFALSLFHYQYVNNKIYNQYINLIKSDVSNIKDYTHIPFLPIELFRTQKIISTVDTVQNIFISSGTTNNQRSKHHIVSLEIYKTSIFNCFHFFWGNPKEFVFFCLVPDLHNNPHSSLSFMCSELINCSNNSKSGFYLKNKKTLLSNIAECQKKKQKFILFGLGFEILKFANKNNIALNGGVVIETGGTKKNKKRIVREDLHRRLQSLLKVKNIYSEYGMAELLSQSYYMKDDCFQSPPWKKILIRDKTNPFKIIGNNNRGCINIIDLANIYSCGFIATNDLGHLNNSGFNIIGRSQNSVERGCNLMV